MSYQVKLRRAAQRQLDRLYGHDYEIVATAISSLEKQPRPRGARKLAESSLWRIRVRSFRVVYAIDDKQSLVTVVLVARRAEDTYKRL